MERDEAIARLKDHETELKQLGIEHLFLFGSHVAPDVLWHVVRDNVPRLGAACCEALARARGA